MLLQILELMLQASLGICAIILHSSVKGFSTLFLVIYIILCTTSLSENLVRYLSFQQKLKSSILYLVSPVEIHIIFFKHGLLKNLIICSKLLRVINMIFFAVSLHVYHTVFNFYVPRRFFLFSNCSCYFHSRSLGIQKRYLISFICKVRNVLLPQNEGNNFF